jgi:hypothetical protein
MRLTVTLNDAEATALKRVANDEARHPRDEARRILIEGLRRQGALPNPRATTMDSPAEITTGVTC